MPRKKKVEEENVEELPYKIVSDEVAGNKVKKVVDTGNGKELFTVSEDFTDDQIDQVFKLCNNYYSLGGQHGTSQARAQLQAALGLTPQHIAGIAKGVYDNESKKESK